MIAGEKTDGGKDLGAKGQGGNLNESGAPLLISENMSKIQFLYIIFSIDICKINMVLLISFDYSPV